MASSSGFQPVSSGNLASPGSFSRDTGQGEMWWGGLGVQGSGHPIPSPNHAALCLRIKFSTANQSPEALKLNQSDKQTYEPPDESSHTTYELDWWKTIDPETSGESRSNNQGNIKDRET